MPDFTSKVGIVIAKPGGAPAAAKEFTDLAKAANDAAKAVKAVKAAGDGYAAQGTKAKESKPKSAASAYAEQLSKENRETRSGARKERSAAREAQRIKGIEEAAEQRKAQQKEQAQERQRKYAGQTRMISNVSRGGLGGGLSAMGGKAGVVGAAIEAAGQVMDRTTKAADILNDSYLTGAQKTRALVSEFVPLGDKMIKLGDAIEGTADKVKRQQEKRFIQGGQEDIRAAYRGKIAPLSLEDVGNRATAAAGRSVQLSGQDFFDRTTLAGERGDQKQGLTLGALDDSTRAKRERMAAYASKKAADDAVKEAEKRVAAKQAQVDDLQLGFENNTGAENAGKRDQVARDKAAGNLLMERNNLSKEIAAREAAIAAAKEKGVAAIQAEAQERAANVKYMQAELAVLEQQEARMRGMAQGAGAMSQGEFLASANALKAYQDSGGEAPPEIEAMVAKLAPDLVRKNQENRGGGRYDQLKGLLGEDGFKNAFGEDFGAGSSLKEVMANKDKLKADMRVTIDIDSQAMANDLAKILAPVLANLKVSMEMEIKNLEGKIKAGTAVRNNSAN